MAIPRNIRTRALQAVIAFIRADADYSALTGTGTRIFAQPYVSLGSVTMNPDPRQLHVFCGASAKIAGTGRAWDRVFDVVIEYYSPRNEQPPADADTTIDDELDELANRLYDGEVTNSPGRFEDPDNAGTYITTGIERILVDPPRVSADESAIRRALIVTFKTREDAQGNRV